MNEFLERLDASVAAMCEKKTGVIYSGGIDSSLLAVLAAKHSDITAYTVGVKGAPDTPFAKQLNSRFKHEIILLSDDDIDLALNEVVPIIKKIEGEVSPVRVGAELPTYFASKAAHKDKLKVALSGQGPDEMFGGYARYLLVLKENGYKGLKELLEFDTQDLRNRIILIDRAICAHNKVELRNPFLSEDFIKYGLSLPIEDRLWIGAKAPAYLHEKSDGKYVIRKFCEKTAAEEILPKEIVWRPKKAAQYGSGVHKALERLAKKHGFKEKAKNAGREGYLTMFLESKL